MISMVQDMAGQMATQKFNTLKPKAKVQGKNTLGGLGSAIENATGIGGGRRVDPIKDVSSGIQAVAHNPIQAVGGALNQVKDEGQKYLDTQLEQLGKGPTSAVQNMAGNLPVGAKSPAEQVLAEQQQSYENFKKNIPRYSQQLQENLGKEANRSMYQNMRGVEQRNVSRGLGYGGLNESMKEGERARSQQQLANQISGANVGLLDLGNQIQSGAIGTGLGMQQDAQQRLNQIYQQQLAKYGADSSAAGSQLGLLANLAMMAALA